MPAHCQHRKHIVSTADFERFCVESVLGQVFNSLERLLASRSVGTRGGKSLT